MKIAVFRRCKAGEKAVGLFGSGKGRAVEYQTLLRPRHGLQMRLGKNMHVVRPLHRQVRTAGAVPVVVAGGDVDLCCHLPQRGGEAFRRVPVGRRAVKEVACQQHQLNAVLIDVVGKALGQLPAFPAAGRRLPGGQGGKSTVQMKIRPMNEFQHRLPLYASFSTGRQPLATSIHATKLEEYFSSSSQVSSMALLLLPAAGNTVSNRFREISR